MSMANYRNSSAKYLHYSNAAAESMGRRLGKTIRFVNHVF